MQHRPGARGQGGQVHLVRPGQALRLSDARRQPLPADGVRDGAIQVGVDFPGRDQGAAEPDQQSHLVVDGLGVTEEGALLAGLGAAEHAADRTVEQADAVVGQAGRGVQHGRDQGGPAAEQRQRPQVLRGVAAALTGELAEPLGVDTLGTGGIEADGAQAGQLLHDAGKGLVAGLARWLPRPSQHAQRRPLPGRE